MAVNSLAAAQQGAEIAEDWITLQHKLRSFTSHVIWNVNLDPNAKEVGREGIQAHVGGFTKAGNPMFNGKDSIWHDNLRGYFDEFVKKNPNGTPAEFLKSLLDKLENGILMWDGQLTKISPQAAKLQMEATYKKITISGESKSEETVEGAKFTISSLSAIQVTNFNRVKLDFTRALAALKVK